MGFIGLRMLALIAVIIGCGINVAVVEGLKCVICNSAVDKDCITEGPKMQMECNDYATFNAARRKAHEWGGKQLVPDYTETDVITTKTNLNYGKEKSKFFCRKIKVTITSDKIYKNRDSKTRTIHTCGVSYDEAKMECQTKYASAKTELTMCRCNVIDGCNGVGRLFDGASRMLTATIIGILGFYWIHGISI